MAGRHPSTRREQAPHRRPGKAGQVPLAPVNPVSRRRGTQALLGSLYRSNRSGRDHPLARRHGRRMNELFVAALDLAAQGLHVFPCHAGTKKPLTEHGLLDATRDEAQIQAWWERWPKAMVAVATGPASGIWVLDID